MSSSQARQLQQTEFDELLRMEAALSNPQNTSTVQPSIPNTTRGPGQLQRPDWRQLLPNLPPLPQRGLGDPNVDWTNTLKDKEFVHNYINSYAMYCVVEDSRERQLQSLPPNVTMQEITNVDPKTYVVDYIFHPGHVYLFASETMKKLADSVAHLPPDDTLRSLRTHLGRARICNMIRNWRVYVLEIMNPDQRNQAFLEARRHLYDQINNHHANGIGGVSWLMYDYMTETFGAYGYWYDPGLSRAQKVYRKEALQEFMKFPIMQMGFTDVRDKVLYWMGTHKPPGIPNDLRDLVLNEFSKVVTTRYNQSAGLDVGQQRPPATVNLEGSQ